MGVSQESVPEREKISSVGEYRAAIPSERFSSECLPYLVLETSFYTNTQFKALKSLEAYK